MRGPGPALLCELFPLAVRTTGLSIGYNLVTAIFGGFAPFIGTWLARETGQEGPGEAGLAQPRHALEQRMPTQDQADQGAPYRLALPDDHPADALLDRQAGLPEPVRADRRLGFPVRGLGAGIA